MLEKVTRLYRHNKREILFFLGFAGVFILLQTVYYHAAPFIAPFIQKTLNADVVGALIGLVTPDEHVTVSGIDLIGPHRGALRVGTGCDGVGGMLLLTSAVIAYPGSWSRRLIGVAAGIAVLYCVNILRIAGLYYSWQYRPELFEFMHVYVGQGFIIFAAVLFFILWIGLRRGDHA